MHEQQNNMIVNNNKISTEKFQSIENCTREIKTSTTSQLNGIYLINNNNNINNNLIKKTSPLSMPSGIVIMQPNQDIEINQQQQHHQNDNYTSNKNTKDFIFKKTNLNNKSQSIIINNNNNNLNSHNINNSKIKNIKKKSAFHYNSDNNNLNLTKSLIIKHSKQQQNGFNTIKLIDNNNKIQSTTITTIPPPLPPINKNLLISKLSSSSIDNHLNTSTYNRQRSLIEDVHNYSKKSNNINDDYNIEMELSSNYSNNSSDDYETGDDFDELINMNKIKNNFDNKKHCVVNETDNNNKWLKTINNHNDNKIMKKRKIQNNDYDDDDCINYNDDNHINNNNNKLLKKSKTPDSGVPDDIDDKLTPDHHARRPMNAFLIFCKRHRAIVRDKYKNVENRQITKILGEWWANMTADEKSCYANLAKENKDQFLSANPNFKWYKLPAPPLRTLTTRPNNNTLEKIDDINKNQLNIKSDFNEHINNNSTSNCQQHHKKLLSPINKKSSSSSSQTNNVGVFKFADETQMGSLNNLIGGGDGNGGDNNVNSPTHLIKSSSLSPSNDAAQLQNALGETSDYLCNTITQTNFSQQHEPFENMRDHAKKMKNSKLNMKRKLLPSTIITKNDNHNDDRGNKIMLRDNSFSSSGEDDGNIINRKLSRTCKGKKYEELIKSGQISIINKKSKKSNYLLHNNHDDHSYNNTDNQNNNLKDSSSDSDYYNNHNNISPTNIQQNSTVTNNIDDHDDDNHEIVIDNNNTIMKKQQYDLIDFDLDSRIMALPAQCLEQYLIKKQESKSKKKINTKRRNKTIGGYKKQNINSNNNNNNNNNIDDGVNNKVDIKQQFNKEQIVGSQKRKARKESITRRDINAIKNETAKIVNYVVLSSGTVDTIDDTTGATMEIEIIEIKEENDLYDMDTINTATDLHTLAEAASNADE